MAVTVTTMKILTRNCKEQITVFFENAFQDMLPIVFFGFTTTSTHEQ